MEHIDLDAIIKHQNVFQSFNIQEIKNCMKEAIHQTLVLASEKATTTTEAYNDWSEEGGIMWVVDKQSILDVQKLIR